MSKQNNEEKDKTKRKHTYFKFIIRNEKTLEEVTSFRLTKLGTLLTVGAFFIFVFAVISALVIFTPVRYYLPNSIDTHLRSELIEANLKIDSLNSHIRIHNAQLQAIKSAINSEVIIDSNFYNLDSLVASQIDSIDLAKTPREAEFCRKHEQQQLQVAKVEDNTTTKKTQKK